MLKHEYIIVYNLVRNDSIIQALSKLIGSYQLNESKNVVKRNYYLVISELISKNIKSIYDYVNDLLICDENVFSISCEKNVEVSDVVQRCVKNDLNVILEMINYDFNNVIDNIEDDSRLLEGFLETSCNKIQTPDKLFDKIKYYYNNKGCGDISKYPAFYIKDDNTLVPAVDYSPIKFENIYIYEQQKEKMRQNIKSLVSGYRAHNVLLVGASGTGKSSLVKSMPELFFDKKLRLIEIKKSQIKSITSILDYLKKRGLYFIILIDDLSFEENDSDFKLLKSIIDGGIEEIATNIIFCITSNRRHLIKEKALERRQDMHYEDLISENLSLKERFGLILQFLKMTRVDFFDMVHRIASEKGVEICESELLEKAHLWEIHNSSRSGRSASQFVDELIRSMEV